MNSETIYIEMSFKVMSMGELFEKIKMQSWTYNYTQEARQKNVSQEYRQIPIGKKEVESRK